MVGIQQQGAREPGEIVAAGEGVRLCQRRPAMVSVVVATATPGIRPD
jgi:hypothetical protein